MLTEACILRFRLFIKNTFVCIVASFLALEVHYIIKNTFFALIIIVVFFIIIVSSAVVIISRLFIILKTENKLLVILYSLLKKLASMFKEGGIIVPKARFLKISNVLGT